MTDFLIHLAWLTLSFSLVILLVLLWSRLFGGRFSAKSRYAVWTVIVLSLCVGVGLYRLPALVTFEVTVPSFAVETPVDDASAPLTPQEGQGAVPPAASTEEKDVSGGGASGNTGANDSANPNTGTNGDAGASEGSGAGVNGNGNGDGNASGNASGSGSGNGSASENTGANPNTGTHSDAEAAEGSGAGVNGNGNGNASENTGADPNAGENPNGNQGAAGVQGADAPNAGTPSAGAQGAANAVLPRNIPLILLAVWAIGAVAYFAVSLAVYLRSTHKYARAKALCDAETAAVFAAACRKYGIRRAPRLYACRAVGSPVLYGYTRPTVLLPELALSKNELVGVLAHELTHYRRHDLWVKLACLLTASLHWFNPLVHLAAARCQAEMELSCDEAVLWGTDGEVRRTYGNVMLDIVAYCSRRRSGLTTHFNPHKMAVKERLVNILDATKKRRGHVILLAVLVLCVAMGAVIGCGVKHRDDEARKQTVYTAQVGITRVDAAVFEGVDTDVITELVIGKDVERIDFAYINTLPALAKVTVDEENAHYRSYENQYGARILMSLRSEEIFYIPSTEDNAVDLMEEAAFAEQYDANENISLYTCGGLLNVYFTQDEYTTYWNLTSLSYDGLTKEIGYDKQISGNCSFRAFRIGGGFVAVHAYYTWSNAFIFKDGAFIEHNPDREIVNGSYGIVCEGDGIRFYPGEGGELLYSRITERMVAMQTPDWFLHLTSAEDFWKEDGIVTISDGALIYTPTKTHTVTDYLAGRGTTVEEYFESLKQAGHIRYNTVEEMFAANKNATQLNSDSFSRESTSDYIHVDTISALPQDPSKAWKIYDPMMSPIYYFFDNGLTYYCRYEYNGEHYEKNTLILPDGYTNGEIFYVRGTGGSASMYIIVKTDQGYLRYHAHVNHSPDEIVSVTELTDEEVDREKEYMASENLQTYMRELVAYLHEPFKPGEAQYPDTILGLVYEYCFYNRDILEGVTVNEEAFGVAIDGEVFRTVAKSLLGDDFSVNGRSLVGGGYDEANDKYTTSYAKDYWGGDRYTIEWNATMDVYEEDGKVTVTAMVGVDDEVYGSFVPFRPLEYTFVRVKGVGCYHYQLEKITEVVIAE